jgi:uncharacterized protein YjbI with pentapeptide repeats
VLPLRLLTISLAIAAGLLALGLIALLGTRLWEVPPHVLGSVAPYEREKLATEYRRTLIAAATAGAQIVGGILLLAGLYFTWRSSVAAERTLALATEGQVTERLTRATEQLGAEQLGRRLGGIYGLERIARDSERDHWPVMEILSAYARERGRTASALDEDIHAILKVIGRRQVAHEVALPAEARIDLSGIVLTDIDLSGGNFTRVSFARASLSGAKFERAMLAGCDFDSAKLEGALLNGADLTGASLNSAVLTSAWLYDVKADNSLFELADLRKARSLKGSFRRASFRGAKLNQTSFHDSDLSGADLEGSDSAGVTLVSTLLTQAKLESSLEQADLRGADLRGVASVYASFHGADLRGAKLQGVDLTHAQGLTLEQLAAAVTDGHTTLPAYLRGSGSAR